MVALPLFGRCMEPAACPLDLALTSPKAVPQVGELVVAVVDDIPSPTVKRWACEETRDGEPGIVLEQDSPPHRRFYPWTRIQALRGVLGIIREADWSKVLPDLHAKLAAELPEVERADQEGQRRLAGGHLEQCA